MQLNYLTTSLKLLHPEWHDFLINQYSAQLQLIDRALNYTTEIIFPPRDKIFRALSLAPKQIKVVILGQDPYHGVGEASGLAFHVEANAKMPPSLRNIFKELAQEFNSDYKVLLPSIMEAWHQNGVLLLNTSLTVLKDQANSMADIGWEPITNAIIQYLSQNNQFCVFMLWGKLAQNKKSLINPKQHLILESAHPSPLSAHRGFFGNNHFILANQYLQHHHQTTINWQGCPI